MMNVRIAVAAPLSVLLAACSTSAHSQLPIDTTLGSAPSEDAGFIVQSDGGLVCPPIAATACNTLGICGTQSFVSQTAEDPPNAQGGTITPGTYVMSAYVNYTGAGGDTESLPVWFRELFTLTAASDDDGGTSPGSQTLAVEDAQDSSEFSGPMRSTGTWFAEGASLNIDYSCSGEGTGEVDYAYTATPTTITLIVPQTMIEGTGVIAFTRIN